MIRKISVQVRKEHEAKAIECALEDNEVRTMLVVLGSLKPLPTKRLQEAVLNCAIAYLEDHDPDRLSRG